MFNLGLIYHFGSTSSYGARAGQATAVGGDATSSSTVGSSSRTTSPGGSESISHLGDGGSTPETTIKIDLLQAQKFYQMALQEESKAQAPVYLLYLYSKWQSIDLYQSIVKDLIMESILQSPSNQLKIVFGFLSYFGLLWRTVNYLRKDHIER